MKRRKTKKNIRKEERYLAGTALEYLKSRNHEDVSAQDSSTLFLCSALTYLLSWHLQLNSAWDYKERWLDGISYPQIELQSSGVLKIAGKMVWGQMNSVGGEQWDEPFKATVQMSSAKGRVISYKLSFGDEKNKYVFHRRGEA